MNKTGIEYLDLSWNPLAMRCKPVSVGCKNCWHLRMADRLANNPKMPEAQRWAYSGLWSPKLVRLEEPLKRKKPARIGVQFMGDLFFEEIPADDIISIFEVMSYAKQHTFIVLTKRPERIASVLYGEAGNWYLGGGDYISNVWLGVSVENQQAADERIPLLLQVPAAVRFVSVEPMLEVVDLSQWLEVDYATLFAESKYEPISLNDPRYEELSWVIAGAESGPGARPMDEDWVRDLRDQCDGWCAFFYKQRINGGKKVSMPELDGQVWDQMPQS